GGAGAGAAELRSPSSGGGPLGVWRLQSAADLDRYLAGRSPQLLRILASHEPTDRSLCGRRDLVRTGVGGVLPDDRVSHVALHRAVSDGAWRSQLYGSSFGAAR